MVEDVFPMDKTICKDCVYRFSRLLIPFDYESWGIDIEDFELKKEEALIIEQHVCLILQQDLDGIVRKCNSFKKKSDNINFFNSNPFINSE